MNSEIFDEYTKIAKEKGLVKEAAEETNPSYESRDLSAVEALYGVQPNGKDDDILDKAHPEPVVVAPSYDRFNALVENLKERHDMMAYIALKPNDGKLTQHRYVKAQKELVDELVKGAFMLDRTKNENLMTLADSCSGRLVKEALPPLAIAGIVAGVVFAVGGLTKLFSNTTLVQGVEQNAIIALEEISDMLVDDYPQMEPDLRPLVNSITRLRDAAEAVKSIKIRSGPEVDDDEGVTSADVRNAAIQARVLYKQDAVKMLRAYKKLARHVSRIIPKFIKLIQLRETQYRSKETSIYRMLRKVKEFIVQSDVEDVTDALEALNEAIAENSKQISSHEELIKYFNNEEDVMTDIKASYKVLKRQESALEGKTPKVTKEKEEGVYVRFPTEGKKKKERTYLRYV